MSAVTQASLFARTAERRAASVLTLTALGSHLGSGCVEADWLPPQAARPATPRTPSAAKALLPRLPIGPSGRRSVTRSVCQDYQLTPEGLR
jgi:hypothetical protein